MKRINVRQLISDRVDELSAIIAEKKRKLLECQEKRLRDKNYTEPCEYLYNTNVEECTLSLNRYILGHLRK